MIHVHGQRFELVTENKDGWNIEAFREKYFDEIFDKYDYIVGDWGYDKLRLKGFYEKDKKDVPLDQTISTLEDYIYEYCNFGCAYFVLKRVK